MGKEALGLSRSALVDAGFIPENLSQGYQYTRIESFPQLLNLLRLVSSQGTYRERFGDYGAENDPSFQQAIFYGVVIRSNGKFLLYQRSEGEEQYLESRLSGKVSVGIGGHMESTDLSFADSFYRELEEETELYVNGSPVNLRGEQGKVNIRLMKSHISIKPAGIIKDERDEVGKVHFGIVCRIEPKSEDVEVRVKAGGAEENVSFEYITIEEYTRRKDLGEFIPESWTDIVFKEELAWSS